MKCYIRSLPNRSTFIFYFVFQCSNIHQRLIMKTEKNHESKMSITIHLISYECKRKKLMTVKENHDVMQWRINEITSSV